MLDGGGEFVAYRLDDQGSAADAECGLAEVAVEVVFFQLVSGREPQEQAFGEEWLEYLGEVEGKGVPVSLHGGVQEADPAV